MTPDGASAGRVLIVAGSDSGGGAGIQADIKTVTALGGYAATAITALTVQDTRRVHAIHPVPAEAVAHQMTVVLDDIGADCLKTGMLGSRAVVEAVADTVQAHAADVPLVVDPVLAATSGDALAEPSVLAALKDRLVPRATVLTPNIGEAEALTGQTIACADDMARAAATLHGLGAKAVLVKGGHLAGPDVTDVLVDASGEQRWSAPRIDSRHTHGTGCTLASAIAAGLAQGLAVVPAVTRARAYVAQAIRTAPGLGKGHGPLNHGFCCALHTGSGSIGQGH